MHTNLEQVEVSRISILNKPLNGATMKITELDSSRTIQCLQMKSMITEI